MGSRLASLHAGSLPLPSNSQQKALTTSSVDIPLASSMLVPRGFGTTRLATGLGSSTMRLRYHKALLLALALPFPRLRWKAGFEARTDTSTPSLGEHLASLRAGSSSHQKSSQPGLLLLLSISSPATTVISLPHTSFWTSPPGLLLNGSSLVRLTPVTQHAVCLHTTAVVRLFVIVS
ncbi:hypothetical protein E2C01_062842 [Portunus trituberculatus]|uniref:Uncharacterized protein n=1 Tax=Portunus trituberculatus TaxID=210409 RepID=A0A5B7HG06_PORTR|nr:hypothetical protein [Portunus trituberculatus]